MLLWLGVVHAVVAAGDGENTPRAGGCGVRRATGAPLPGLGVDVSHRVLILI